jgi:hypothetical protein
LQNSLITEKDAIFRSIFGFLRDCAKEPTVEHFLYPIWELALQVAFNTLHDRHGEQLYCVTGQFPLLKNLHGGDHRERVTPDFLATLMDDTARKLLMLIVEIKPLNLPYDLWFGDKGKAAALGILNTVALQQQMTLQNHFAKKHFGHHHRGWGVLIGIGVWFRLYQFTAAQVQNSAWKITSNAGPVSLLCHWVLIS